MRFGPFTVSIARSLTNSLSANQIPFEVEEDRELLVEEERRWKEIAAQPIANVDRRGPPYDPAFVFLVLEDQLFNEPNPALEALGLTNIQFEPDFSKEEFVCRKCEKVKSENPGLCPKHKEILIAWSQFMEEKRAYLPPQPKWGWLWAVLLIMAFAAVFVVIPYLKKY